MNEMTEERLTEIEARIRISRVGSLHVRSFGQDAADLIAAVREARRERDEALAWLDIATTAGGVPDHAKDNRERAMEQASARYSAAHPSTKAAREACEEAIEDVERELR